MIVVPLVSPFLWDVDCLAGGPAISVMIAWFRQPSALNSAPRPCISFNRILPALSMKLTPHRLILNLCFGVEATSSRQHCSRAATHWPARRPSTDRIVLPRLCSVVMRSMVYLCQRVQLKLHRREAPRMAVNCSKLYTWVLL